MISGFVKAAKVLLVSAAWARLASASSLEVGKKGGECWSRFAKFCLLKKKS